MYLLEHTTQSVTLHSWTEVESHPLFLESTVYELVPGIGWVVI